MPGMSCAILAHERETVLKIFEIVKRAYENLPDELKPETRTDTKMAYDFVTAFDGTKLDSSIYVAMRVRGGTVQRLHVTESAYVKDRQELVAGSMQAVPITGSITEETTANGFNEFYDAFMDSWAKPSYGELDYKGFFYAWHENPEYALPGFLDHETLSEKEKRGIELYHWSDAQINWRRWKIKELSTKSIKEDGVGLSGEQLFMQEYPSSVAEAFQSGAGSVFNQEIIDSISAVVPMSIKYFPRTYDDLFKQNETYYSAEWLEKMHNFMRLGWWIWEVPNPEKRYVIGCDPSDGTGSDFSVIDVWEKEGLAQVAQLKIKCDPQDLAQYIADIGFFYNTAFVGIENNRLSTLLFFRDLYDHYYYNVEQDKKTLKRTKTLGWNTNTKTRDIMIDDFDVALNDGSLTIRSATTLGEARTFVKKENGKREHASGKHDDSLFAAFICIQMRKLEPKKSRAFANNPL